MREIQIPHDLGAYTVPSNSLSRYHGSRGIPGRILLVQLDG